MVRLHPSRLMRSGEVMLWYRGKIVWQGSVGDNVQDVAFVAVSLNSDDGARISAQIGEHLIAAEAMRAVLADWWA